MYTQVHRAARAVPCRQTASPLQPWAPRWLPENSLKFLSLLPQTKSWKTRPEPFLGLRNQTTPAQGPESCFPSQIPLPSTGRDSPLPPPTCGPPALPGPPYLSVRPGRDGCGGRGCRRGGRTRARPVCRRRQLRAGVSPQGPRGQQSPGPALPDAGGGPAAAPQRPSLPADAARARSPPPAAPRPLGRPGRRVAGVA